MAKKEEQIRAFLLLARGCIYRLYYEHREAPAAAYSVTIFEGEIIK